MAAYLDLKYPPLKPGETRERRIAGVTVIQRHDWTLMRYKEIKASLEGKRECSPYQHEWRISQTGAA